MYPQHQGASTSSYQSISPWDTRKKLVAMVEEVREGEREGEREGGREEGEGGSRTRRARRG